MILSQSIHSGIDDVGKGMLPKDNQAPGNFQRHQLDEGIGPPESTHKGKCNCHNRND